jgi:ABC-type transporter Mla MlaB component
MHGFSRCLDLFNFKDGIIKDPHQHLLKFDSVKEVIMLKKIGSIHQISAKSVSLIDSACMVILHHHDYQKLENDSAEIYGLEKQGQLV